MPDTASIDAYWQLTCRSAQSHAASMAANCRHEAAALIRREAENFCRRESPKSRAELSRRQKQATYLTAKISAVSHADRMARSHPRISDEILAEARAFLDRLSLEDSPFDESMALTSKISALCFSDMMQKA